MKTLLELIGGIVFTIGFFIALGTPDFIGLGEMVKQFGIGVGLMLSGWACSVLSGC